MVYQPLQVLCLGNALRAEDHRLDRLGIHQAHQHTVNTLRRLRRTVTQQCALRHQCSRFAGGAVPHLHAVPCGQQALDHGSPHQAQATKSKLHAGLHAGVSPHCA